MAGAGPVSPALWLGGLGALCWGGAALLTAPSSRTLGVSRSVLWLGVVGVPLGAALAVADGPLRVRTADLPGLLGAATFLLVATQLWSLLVGRGRVSLAAPIVACDGAIAALAAVLSGHHLQLAAYAGLTLMVTGLVVLSATEPGSVQPLRGQSRPAFSRTATVWLAVAAAGCYGGMLFCAGGVEGTSPLWTVTIARGVATVAALAICVGQGRVRPSRMGLRYAAGAGALDMAAFALFVAGARHDLAIAAVAVSQYGAVAALAGIALLGERLSGRQAVGVAVLVAGAGIVATTG